MNSTTGKIIKTATRTQYSFNSACFAELFSFVLLKFGKFTMFSENSRILFRLFCISNGSLSRQSQYLFHSIRKYCKILTREVEKAFGCYGGGCLQSACLIMILCSVLARDHPRDLQPSSPAWT